MYEKIKEEFKDIIRETQGIKEPKVEKLFNIYDFQKKNLRKELGFKRDKLIIESPQEITFSLGEKEKKSSFERLKRFSVNYTDFFNFLTDKDESWLFDNEIKETCYPIVNGKNITVPKGMKFIKSFKFFIEDKDKLLQVQDYASSLLQKHGKFTGKLCISIHPLDYLTISDNALGWSSCHSLDNEHRAGNLSYMCDSSTVVCYLKSSDDNNDKFEFSPEVKWNSKKWRVLLHFSDDFSMVFAGRQYPFSSSCGLQLINELFLKNFKNNWKDSVVESVKVDDRTIDVSDERYYLLTDQERVPYPTIKRITDLVKDKSFLHYNDLLYSNIYNKPYYCFSKKTRATVATTFTIGFSKIPCLECEEDNITLGSTMRCIPCEEEFGYEENDDFVYCSCCGRRVFINNATEINTFTEEFICCDCEKTFYKQCSNCGDYILEDEAIYCPEDGNYYCIPCAEESNFIEERDIY